jgi:hypothetical protein
MTRFYAPATLIPMTAITWTPLWTVTAIGLMDSTPLEITGVTDPMNQLQVTWDPGIGIAPTAREVDITDIASSANSLLDNLVVNGVQVWTVNKEGVLIHGQVPASAIFPPIPSFNDPTFTGTATFDGPADFNGPVTMNDGLTVTAGETLLEGTLTSTIGSTLDGGTTVGGGMAVTGGLTTDSLGVTGNASVGGSLGVTGNFGVDGSSTFDGTATFDGTVQNGAGGPVVPISSPDASISVVTVGNGYHIETAAAPIAPGSTYVDTAFFGFGSTAGTFSIGPLPGTAVNTFRIICWGTLQFQDGSKELTLTGVVATGVTWDIASQAYENSQSGSFPFMYFGNGKGGTTPTVNWTCNDMIAFTPMFVTIMASITL